MVILQWNIQQREYKNDTFIYEKCYYNSMVRKSVDFGQKTVSKCKHLYSRSAIIYTIERENLLYE